MDEKLLRNNHIVTLVKFLLFLVGFCFLIEMTQEFFKVVRISEGFDMTIFYYSILAAFSFYVLIADLNEVYGRLQRFFFRNSFFYLVTPILIILLSLALFLLPKIFNIHFSKELILFLGGFLMTCHLIFIARETKGDSLSTFINYLFIFSILYIINLILFGLYLKTSFRFQLGTALGEGVKDGVFLIKSLIIQLFQ